MTIFIHFTHVHLDHNIFLCNCHKYVSQAMSLFTFTLQLGKDLFSVKSMRQVRLRRTPEVSGKSERSLRTQPQNKDRKYARFFIHRINDLLIWAPAFDEPLTWATARDFASRSHHRTVENLHR